MLAAEVLFSPARALGRVPVTDPAFRVSLIDHLTLQEDLTVATNEGDRQARLLEALPAVAAAHVAPSTACLQDAGEHGSPLQTAAASPLPSPTRPTQTRGSRPKRRISVAVYG
jgi:hypothetical protein